MDNADKRQSIELGERLVSLDILRGLPLIGMILVHMHQRMRVEVARDP